MHRNTPFCILRAAISERTGEPPLAAIHTAVLLAASAPRVPAVVSSYHNDPVCRFQPASCETRQRPDLLVTYDPLRPPDAGARVVECIEAPPSFKLHAFMIRIPLCPWRTTFFSKVWVSYVPTHSKPLSLYV